MSRSLEQLLAEAAERDEARSKMDPAEQLRDFVKRGGPDGWLMTDYDADIVWSQAGDLMKRGWVTYRGLYTGTGLFELTEGGRVALTDHQTPEDKS